MGIARGDVHHLHHITRHLVLYDLFGPDLPEPYDCLPLHHRELLVLRVVPVVSLGDGRVRDVHRELATFGSAYDLGERATLIRVHLQRVAEAILGEEGEVGRVERLLEGVPHIGNREGAPALLEGVQEVHDGLQCHRMDGGDDAEAIFLNDLPLQGVGEFTEHIIDIDKSQNCIGVIDLDGKIPGYIVAEGCHGTIVVGPGPFAEDIGKAVEEEIDTILFCIPDEQLLPRLLAPAIGVVQLCLDRGGDEDGGLVVMFLELTKEQSSEVPVALKELSLVLGPVDTGQVEDEVTLLGIAVKELFVGIHIVKEELVFIPTLQFCREVPSDEAA